MADQRQPFRFRLPWLAAPQPQPAPAPRPTTPAQAQPDRVPDAPRPATPAQAQPDRVPDAPRPRTPAQTQRPPFRPAGVAPPARAEPPPSPSRATSQTRGAPPSPNRPANRLSPQPQEAPRASPPRPSQPAPKSPVQPKKETEISQQPRDEPIKPEETQPLPPSQKPQHVEVVTPSPPPQEKVVESLAEEKKLPEASREIAKEVSSPKQETKKQQPIKVEQPTQMPKGMKPDEIKQKPVATDEVVIDKKEVKGHEKETRAAHRPAMREKKEDTPKFVQKHENPNSIITLTGENTGASMHLSSSDSSSKRERPIHIHRGYKSNPYGSDPNTTSDGDEGSRKSQDPKGVPDEEEAMKNIYVNNNVQGINNSLVFSSSLSQRNPGVHLALSLSRSNPVEPVVKSGEETRTVDARKSEVATTPTERLAYAPNIRRRCLRGLFLESSDSEPDNAEKSRRHGCQVGCSQKSKDGKIDVL